MRERTETGSLRLELICISHSGTTLVINLYYHFNDSVDLIIFARRFAFVAMTSWMTPMQLPMGGGMQPLPENGFWMWLWRDSGC